MKAHPEIYAVCAGALVIGVVLGATVIAKPRGHRAAPHTIAEASGEAQAPSRQAIPISVQVPAMPAGIYGPDATTAVQAARAPSVPQALRRRAVIDLADRCAPSEPSSVLASIARVESGYHPLMIGVNSSPRQVFEPPSREQAASLAAALIASGASVDLGLAQINSQNLGWLDLSVEDAFDPCRNLAAAAKVMTQGYKIALKISPSDRSLLQSAYSLYNTGDISRGLSNGYVDRIEGRR